MGGLGRPVGNIGVLVTAFLLESLAGTPAFAEKRAVALRASQAVACPTSARGQEPADKPGKIARTMGAISEFFSGADGENGYSYGPLLEQKFASTPGGRFIAQLVRDPRFTEAIRADAALLKSLLEDPLLQKAFSWHPNYRKIIERGPSLQFLFTESSGTGYTVGEHTTRVLNNFEREKDHYQLSQLRLPSGVRPERIETLMRHLLAFHDIGKSVAVAAGNKDLQDLYNSKFLPVLMRAAGFNEAEVRLAESLETSDDAIGGFLQGKNTMEESSALLQQQARRAGMEPSQFFRLQKLFFTSDAAAYPEVRRRVFREGPKTGRLIPEAWDFKRLAATVGYLEPVLRPEEPEYDYPYGPVFADPERGGGIFGVYGDRQIGKLLKNAEANTLFQNSPAFQAEVAADPSIARDAAIDPGFGLLMKKGPTLRYLLGQSAQPYAVSTIGQEASERITRFDDRSSKFKVAKGDRRAVETALLLKDIAIPVFGRSTGSSAVSGPAAMRGVLMRKLGLQEAEIRLVEILLGARALEAHLDAKKLLEPIRQRLPEIRRRLATEAEGAGMPFDKYVSLVAAYSAGLRDRLQNDARYVTLVDYLKTGQLPTKLPREEDDLFYGPGPGRGPFEPWRWDRP